MKELNNLFNDKENTRIQLNELIQNMRNNYRNTNNQNLTVKN